MTPPPPVPPIPPRWSSFTSFPGLRASIPFPPVRANRQPIVLNSERQPSAGPSTHQLGPPRTFLGVSSAPTAAPPSYHTPVMGLGGALISSNNARAQQEATHAARMAQTRMLLAARRRRHTSFMNPATFADLLLHNDEDGHPHIRRWVENQHENFLRLYNRLRGREEPPPKHHLQHYTHPDQPEPGFTFDFAPNSSDDDLSRTRHFPRTSVNAPIIVDDDDEQSTTEPSTSTAAAPSTLRPSESTKSSKLTTLLVCARCLEPLLLNESLGPDDDGRRVWALRCGHVVDEKCLNEIGQPDDDDAEAESQNPPLPSRKSKGKAKAKSRPTYSEAVAEVIEANNSIRSRLRSATTAGTSSSASNAVPTSSTAGTAETSSPSRAPPPKRRRTTALPKVEAEFEWKCPVPSCGLVHASVKIDGKWGPEKDTKSLFGAPSIGGLTKATPRGAIPVFA